MLKRNLMRKGGPIKSSGKREINTHYYGKNRQLNLRLTSGKLGVGLFIFITLERRKEKMRCKAYNCTNNENGYCEEFYVLKEEGDCDGDM